MHLQQIPFKMISDGTKTIEIRLNDEKRRKIVPGDSIEFSHALKPEMAVTRTVAETFRFDSFKELLAAFPYVEYGGDGKADLSALYAYYSHDDETKFGVLAIRLKK